MGEDATEKARITISKEQIAELLKKPGVTKETEKVYYGPILDVMIDPDDPCQVLVVYLDLPYGTDFDDPLAKSLCEEDSQDTSNVVSLEDARVRKGNGTVKRH